MPLPQATDREPLHERSISYRGYLRADGRWDIDAWLRDVKAYDREVDGRLLSAGTPVHDMGLRVTLDDGLEIVAIEVAMDSAPFAECRRVQAKMQALVGARLGRGWRDAIQARIGGIEGCTHLRELLFGVATAAIQTIPPVLARRRAASGIEVPGDSRAPAHLNTCLGWDATGPAVLRYYPKHARTAGPGS
ncbi:DUF2889 domain-containing protein [Variovorax paradoxus]|uniref:DUF2889 domain-containing protein n=1 Tax=Variovorax paradoxus TaxID=34073 RepID=UPI00193313C3|nr:DUF2889 domain-containing protein [Variovorax paradoxus]